MSYTRSYAANEPTRVEVDALAGVTVVEFGAPWCGHCIVAQPLLEAALARHPDVRHLKIEDGRGRLRVSAHLAGHHDVGGDPARGQCGAEHARLLVTGGGEVVVVGGPEGCLAVPDEEDATHVMSPSSRRPMICTAGPKRAYISLVVWPWNQR